MKGNRLLYTISTDLTLTIPPHKRILTLLIAVTALLPQVSVLPIGALVHGHVPLQLVGLQHVAAASPAMRLPKPIHPGHSLPRPIPGRDEFVGLLEQAGVEREEGVQRVEAVSRHQTIEVSRRVEGALGEVGARAGSAAVGQDRLQAVLELVCGGPVHRCPPTACTHLAVPAADPHPLQSKRKQLLLTLLADQPHPEHKSHELPLDGLDAVPQRV
mmetsp:Transcript_23596/g.32276  ORF Transcript_23596/g.32276 Transcript_23596/m.32276 type:complete len:215 (+) Transcript_23596:189-833(+)